MEVAVVSEVVLPRLNAWGKLPISAVFPMIHRDISLPIDTFSQSLECGLRRSWKL